MVTKLVVSRKIGLFLVLGLSFVFLHSGTASAAYADIPTTLPAEANQYVNIGLTTQSSSGSGGYVPSATFKFYTKNPGSIVGQTIPIQMAKAISDYEGSGNDCSQIRKIRYTIRQVNSDGSLGGVFATDYLRRSDNNVNLLCSTNGLPINGNYFTASNKPEKTGIYELYVQLTMEYADACYTSGHSYNDGHSNGSYDIGGQEYHENHGFFLPGCMKPTSFLKINPTGAGWLNDLHIGYAASGYLTLYSPIGATYSWPFAPACSTTALSNTLQWGETDQGTSKQPDSGFQILLMRDGGVLTDLTNRSNKYGGVAYGIGSYGVNARSYPANNPYNDPPWAATSKYELRMSGVKEGNGIWASLPYDSGDFYLGCPKPFDTTGSANVVVDDEENPTRITASGNVNEARPPGGTEAPLITSTLSIKRYRNGVEQPIPNLPGSPNSVTNNNFSWVGQVRTMNLTYNIPGGARSLGWEPGDKICSVLTWTYKKGTVVPGDASTVNTNPPGGQRDGSTSTSSTDCGGETITNKPYVSVYGGDVSAGGGFGNACAGASNIEAYYKAAGSGTQLAAFAGGTISGFKSAMLRGSLPMAPNGLSFGNDGALGGFAQANECTPDYYSVEQYDDGSRKTVINGNRTQDVSGLTDNAQTVINGDLTIEDSLPGPLEAPFVGHHTIFVDGDVFINKNIKYANVGSGWATIVDIPYFTLIVKGNIYIAPGVSELTGKYIAQQNGSDANTGHIYTCAPSIGVTYNTTGSAIWDSCRSNKLTIYGQFVANKIHFVRSIGTISEGSSGERAGASKAAEEFIFSPEMYLGLPATRPTATSTSGVYESVTNLPPIL